MDINMFYTKRRPKKNVSWSKIFFSHSKSIWYFWFLDFFWKMLKYWITFLQPYRFRRIAYPNITFIVQFFHLKFCFQLFSKHFLKFFFCLFFYKTSKKHKFHIITNICFAYFKNWCMVNNYFWHLCYKVPSPRGITRSISFLNTALTITIYL